MCQQVQEWLRYNPAPGAGDDIYSALAVTSSTRGSAMHSLYSGTEHLRDRLHSRRDGPIFLRPHPRESQEHHGDLAAAGCSTSEAGEG